MSSEIWFYHLERSGVEQVLPGLLEKTRERGWKAIVRVSDAPRLEEIDEQLWTYRQDSFLAHGRAGDPHEARQPILLTQGMENPIDAQALFILDKAELGETEGFDRCVILFDGRDDQSLAGARVRWKALKDQGRELAYCKQSPEGRWERSA